MTPAGDTEPRFVLVGSALVDIVLGVDHLPVRGGDVLTHGSEVMAGGGFNVLVAARRQGMAAAYGGRIGAGPFGDTISDALAQAGVTPLLPANTEGDTGFCVVIVDESGERTMLTRIGIDADLSPAELAAVEIRPTDTVYVSGYDLAYPHGQVMADWLSAGTDAAEVIFDPGPLVAEIPSPLISNALTHATWISLNAREARMLTGHAEHPTAARDILKRGTNARGVVIRGGATGCHLLLRGGEGQTIPGVAVDAIDTTGAGDCHVGAFAAALARGDTPAQACAWANAAAAIAVSRRGSSTSPTVAEAAEIIAGTAPLRGGWAGSTELGSKARMAGSRSL